MQSDKKKAVVGFLLVLVPAIAHFITGFFGVVLPDLGSLGDIINLGLPGVGATLLAKSDKL